MTAVGFIGLGVMGAPMAANLVKSGFDVTAFSRTERSRNAGRKRGVPVVASLAEAVDGADVVITMLPDSPDVEAVVDALTPFLRRGAILIDSSTIDPDASRRITAALADRGVQSLDAPVSGGEAGAVEGSLSIMVGGLESTFQQALPVLEAVGSVIVRVGEAGAGQVVKAANQMIVAGNIQLLAEALVFLGAQKVPLDTALDVLAGGLAGSTVLQRKRAAMVTSEFAPGFRAKLHDKDLGIAARSARAAGLSLPLSGLVSQLVQSLVARGDGALDHSALYKLTLELNGISAEAGKESKRR